MGKPKRVTTYRTCPECGSRSTKIFSITTGFYLCQICGHEYREPGAKMEYEDLLASHERLKIAVEWYGERATAISQPNRGEQYWIAIYTELSLDNGARAREALKQIPEGE